MWVSCKMESGSDLYVFHGNAERGAARKVHKLLKKGIRFKHKMFLKTGHAELIHKNPKKLLMLIEKAYNKEIV